MTRGRRGEKTYTGQNGAATDKLRAMEKLAHTEAGTASRHAAPSAEALRKYIASGTCPWCDAGPYKNLACHTNVAHGISADEFRDLAGMRRHDPLCSPDLSAAHAARQAGKALPLHAYANIGKTKRRYSEAGKAAQRAKAALVTDEQRAAAARASGDKQLAANAATHAEIVRRYKAGESVPTIAAEVARPPQTVRRTLKREGIWVDGRKLRWSR